MASTAALGVRTVAFGNPGFAKVTEGVATVTAPTNGTGYSTSDTVGATPKGPKNTTARTATTLSPHDLAVRTLEILRGGLLPTFTFHGRLTAQGFEPQKALEQAFPALAAARVLASDPRTARPALIFARELALPDDVKRFGFEAIGVTAKDAESLPPMDVEDWTKVDLRSLRFEPIEWRGRRTSLDARACFAGVNAVDIESLSASTLRDWAKNTYLRGAFSEMPDSVRSSPEWVRASLRAAIWVGEDTGNIRGEGQGLLDAALARISPAVLGDPEVCDFIVRLLVRLGHSDQKSWTATVGGSELGSYPGIGAAVLRAAGLAAEAVLSPRVQGKLDAFVERSFDTMALPGLDPSKARSTDERVAAAGLLLQPDLDDAGQQALLAKLIGARIDGRLAPLSLAGLDAQTRAGLLAPPTTLGRALTAALVLDLGALTDAELTTFIGKLPDDRPPMNSPTFEAVLRSLSTASPQSLQVVFGNEPDTYPPEALALRLAAARLTKDASADDFDAVVKSGDYSAAVAVADMMDVILAKGSDSGIVAAAMAWATTPKHDFGLSATVCRAAFAQFFPSPGISLLADKIDAAVAEYAAALDRTEREAATKRFVAWSKTQDRVVAPGVLADVFLRRVDGLFQGRVESLVAADTAAHGVTPPTAPKAPPDTTHTWLDIEGRDIAKSLATPHWSAPVPTAREADLVIDAQKTPHAHHNFLHALDVWTPTTPMLWTGPTSAGKTAMARYLAWRTDAPFYRINGSPETKKADLFGHWVAPEREYNRAALERLDATTLAALAKKYAVAEGLPRDRLLAELDRVQDLPRFIKGPVTLAYENGGVLVIDEINLLLPDVRRALLSAMRPSPIDGMPRLVLEDVGGPLSERTIKKHPETYIVATENEASYAGRLPLDPAERAVFVSQDFEGLDKTDLEHIVATRYGQVIELGLQEKLIDVHQKLCNAAKDGAVGGSLGGIDYSLRNVFRVAERFGYCKDASDLSGEALLYREAFEVYAGGFADKEERDSFAKVVAGLFDDTDLQAKVDAYYQGLEVEVDHGLISIGDVSAMALGFDHPDVPKAKPGVELTPRQTEALYRVLKAHLLGEAVGLVGTAGVGLETIIAAEARLFGQPYFRKDLDEGTTNGTLIGEDSLSGWTNGVVLEAYGEGTRPGVLHLANATGASSSVTERLNSLFDSRSLQVTEGDGGRVTFPTEAKLIASFEPAGSGSGYSLSRALLNRLTPIFVPEPESEDEYLTIARRRAAALGIPEVVAETAAKVHWFVVDGYLSHTLGANIDEADRHAYTLHQFDAVLAKLALAAKNPATLGQSVQNIIEAHYAATVSSEDNAKVMKFAKALVD